MADHRIGVHDRDAGGVTVWHDMESAETTYLAWRLLRDYGRDGITVTVQLRGTDGAWKTVNPPLVTRPHDWQGDTDQASDDTT
jgi:hypothetical protein